MKIRYHYTNGRGQRLYDEKEMVLELQEDGRVYAWTPNGIREGVNAFYGAHSFIGGPYTRVKESMTEAERKLYAMFLSYWRNRTLETIRRNNANPCYPKHLGPVDESTNGIGGTYHTYYCHACKQTWHIDSGD